MFLLSGEQWPQREPITGREVCRDCWNGNHAKCGLLYNEFGDLRCDHFERRRVTLHAKCDCKFECDCVHLSEATYADEERARSLEARRARRALEEAQLKDQANPLRTFNPEWKPPRRGKRPEA
jgi:hypothetical protein